MAVTDPPSVAFELPDGTLPLTYNFVPAVMHALAYYSEMIQYEQLATTTIEPPIGGAQYNTAAVVQADPITTKKPYVSTKKPTVKPPPPQRTTTR